MSKCEVLQNSCHLILDEVGAAKACEQAGGSLQGDKEGLRRQLKRGSAAIRVQIFGSTSGKLKSDREERGAGHPYPRIVLLLFITNCNQSDNIGSKINQALGTFDYCQIIPLKQKKWSYIMIF